MKTMNRNAARRVINYAGKSMSFLNLHAERLLRILFTSLSRSSVTQRMAEKPKHMGVNRLIDRNIGGYPRDSRTTRREPLLTAVKLKLWNWLLENRPKEQTLTGFELGLELAFQHGDICLELYAEVVKNMGLAHLEISESRFGLELAQSLSTRLAAKPPRLASGSPNCPFDSASKGISNW